MARPQVFTTSICAASSTRTASSCVTRRSSARSATSPDADADTSTGAPPTRVPAEQRRRRNEERRPARRGSTRLERSQQSLISRPKLRTSHLALEQLQLVREHENLDLLRALGALWVPRIRSGRSGASELARHPRAAWGTWPARRSLCVRAQGEAACMCRRDLLFARARVSSREDRPWER